jgi:hypothetical protein
MIDLDFVGGFFFLSQSAGKVVVRDRLIKGNVSECCDVLRTCQTLHSRNANERHDAILMDFERGCIAL